MTGTKPRSFTTQVKCSYNHWDILLEPGCEHVSLCVCLFGTGDWTRALRMPSKGSVIELISSARDFKLLIVHPAFSSWILDLEASTIPFNLCGARDKTQALCELGKHTTNWVTSLAWAWFALFFEAGLTMYPWMTQNSPHGPGWLHYQRSACLCLPLVWEKTSCCGILFEDGFICLCCGTLV